MSINKERVFVVGANGNIGSDIIRSLIKKQIDTTAYVRNEEKAKDLFKDELNTGHLTIVVGTYSTIDVFTKAIQGHTRLFLLVAEVINKPTSMRQIKETFGKIAYEHGVRQIVDLSSSSVSNYGKKGIIAYMHVTAEEKLWTLAEEDPEQRSLVILRPAAFMSNHFRDSLPHVKRANKLISCGLPSSTTIWIDTKDISDCAVVVLTESIEKHDRNIYELGAEKLTNEQRAAIFSKVLGKTIIYEQQSMEDLYKTYTSFGMSHSVVYNFLLFLLNDISSNTTPELAVVLGRPLRTLEQWLTDNVQIFR